MEEQAWWEIDDTNDAERLSVDPVMRQMVGGHAVDLAAASIVHRPRATALIPSPDSQTTGPLVGTGLRDYHKSV